MTMTCNILMICGSLRAGSTNAAVLETARSLASGDVSADIYDGMDRLPHFNPDDDREPLPPAVAALRGRTKAADALLFSTPEYAGGLPGSFKNLLDWTVGGGETYGKPVAWINAASTAAPTGGADAHASLRTVLGYTGADIVEAACVRVPVHRQDVGPDGLISDPSLRAQIGAAVTALADHVQNRRSEAIADEKA